LHTLGSATHLRQQLGSDIEPLVFGESHRISENTLGRRGGGRAWRVIHACSVTHFRWNPRRASRPRDSCAGTPQFETLRRHVG
jgi:hypothetical protein